MKCPSTRIVALFQGFVRVLIEAPTQIRRQYLSYLVGFNGCIINLWLIPCKPVQKTFGDFIYKTTTPKGMGNPRTQWRVLAGKIIDANGELSGKPQLTIMIVYD